jgi:hypothetical protein
MPLLLLLRMLDCSKLDYDYEHEHEWGRQVHVGL